MARVAASYFLVLLVAGCLGDPPAGPAPAPTPASAWKVGDAWRYEVSDGEGRSVGSTSYRVERVVDRDDMTGRVVPMYETSYISVRGDRSESSTRWFEARTLNEHFDECHRPGVMPDCRGVLRWMHLPLAENASWSTRVDGGDVVITFEATPRRVDDDTWRITLVREACSECGEARFEVVFDSTIGNMRERSHYDVEGRLVERWTLVR